MYKAAIFTLLIALTGCKRESAPVVAAPAPIPIPAAPAAAPDCDAVIARMLVLAERQQGKLSDGVREGVAQYYRLRCDKLTPAMRRCLVAANDDAEVRAC